MDRKSTFSSSQSDCIRIGLTQSKKCLFDPNFLDRAIPSAYPVEKVDFFNGMHGSDCSIEKLLEAHRIPHLPKKHTITPYNSSDAGLTCYRCCCSQRVSETHPVLRPPAARTVIRWQQCVLSMTFLQHRCCYCARFGDSRRSPTPQPRR